MSGGLALETDRSGCNQPDVDMQLHLDMEVEKRQRNLRWLLDCDLSDYVW